MVTTKECSKFDPKYAVIAAITTIVNNLKGGNSREGGENPTKTHQQPGHMVKGITGTHPYTLGL